MSDELGSWVVALYTPPGSRPVHKFRLKAWAGFLRERGCLTVVPAEDLRRKATHVLLVDPPPCDDADADNRFGTYLGSMPASCVAGTSGTPPKILRQEWIYDSIREKRPMPTDAYEVTSRNPGQSMTRAPLTAVQPRAPAPVTCHNRRPHLNHLPTSRRSSAPSTTPRMTRASTRANHPKTETRHPSTSVPSPGASPRSAPPPRDRSMPTHRQVTYAHERRSKRSGRRGTPGSWEGPTSSRTSSRRRSGTNGTRGKKVHSPLRTPDGSDEGLLEAT